MARLHVPTPLRWSDLDAYGHVNNVEIIRLLEEARVVALWQADDPAERPLEPGAAVIDASATSETLSIISRTEIEYVKTIEYRRTPIDIQVWIGRMGGADLDVCYELRSPVGQEPSELYARASTTVVLVTASTMRPRRISDDERAAWAPFVEEQVKFAKRPKS